ncbi:MAG: arginase family protein [Bacteroidota bacterium]|nr:arginase family protein [Bacteroidota bacterium]
MNFGNLPAEKCSSESAKVVIIPVLYGDPAVEEGRTSRGPDAILNASGSLRFYDVDTGSDVSEVGIHTAEPIIENDGVKAVETVHKTVLQHLKKKKFCVTLGGDHIVSLGAIRAHFNKFTNLTVVHFDAYPDMRPAHTRELTDHGCLMTRVREMGSFIQIGIRSLNPEESSESIQDRIFYADRIHENKAWLHEMLNKLTSDVYLSIDLHAFDPSLMPAVDTPQAGGLVWYQFMEILNQISDKSSLAGCDICSLSPIPGFNAPEHVAARLVYEIIKTKFFR